MKRFLKGILLAAFSVCALFAIAACSSGTTNSSANSDSFESVSETGDFSDAPRTFYALAIGNDSRFGTLDGPDVTENDPSYSDVIVLMRADLDNNRVSLLTLPRDTEITLDGHTAKLNESFYTGGAEALVKQVEELTGVDIAYHFDLGFAEFAEYIDGLGGVLVNIPFTMSVGDPIEGGEVTLEGGDGQTLDGPEALGFGRQRKQYASDSDACRQIQDRQMIASIVNMVVSQPSSKADTYAEILTSLTNTNMDEELLSYYISEFMSQEGQIAIQSGTGPYIGGTDNPENIWLIPRDEATYHALISAMETGTSLEEIVPLPNVARG